MRLCVSEKAYGHVGPMSDDSLCVSCDETRTLIPQNNQQCGPWEPVDLLTFRATPANLLSIGSSPHGCLLFSELRMALFSCFCLDWFKDPWVLMVNETVIWGGCCRLTVAYIKFTYGKHGAKTKPKNQLWKLDWLKQENKLVGNQRDTMAETVRDFVYLRYSAGNFCLDRFFYFCHIN